MLVAVRPADRQTGRPALRWSRWMLTTRRDRCVACGVEDREWRVRAEKGTEEARTTSVVTA